MTREQSLNEIKTNWKKMTGLEIKEKMTAHFKNHIVPTVPKLDPLKIFDGGLGIIEPVVKTQ